MRQLLLFVSLAMLLVCGQVVLFAQHPSGHASVGHGGFSSGSHSTYGSRSTIVAPTAPPSIGLQRQYSGYTGINRGAISSRPVRSPYRGRIYGGGYFLAPFYYDDSDSYGASYNGPWQSAPPPPQPQAEYPVDDELQRLSAEVDALRNERSYNRPPLVDSDQPPTPALTLILTNGKQLQLKSYAVMGKDIWDFSGATAKRIPLSTVDLASSRKVNEAAGVEFPEVD